MTTEQEISSGLAYCAAALDAANKEADAALTRLETAKRLELAQDWVELARHYSVHPARVGKFVLCRVVQGTEGLWMSIAATSDTKKAWDWASQDLMDIHFVARDGVILMQRKDAPIKPPAPTLSPRMQQAIARAQRLAGVAA